MSFVPAWWCRGAHLQTLWPRLARYRPRIALRRERLELPDGDFLDLDWTPRASGPTVVILHGLEGSSNSPYARGLLKAVHNRGWRGVLMHFRGCSAETNRLPRGYHSGETGDIAHLVNVLTKQQPRAPLAVVGYSLGGNALLKWLGEAGTQAPLSAAVAVSVPFVLGQSADRLHRGFSRIYEWYFLHSLVRTAKRKAERMPLPIDLQYIDKVGSIRQYDDLVTAPLHGFKNADDYYTRSSSRQYLQGIRVDTLMLQAADDPFMPPSVIPAATELSPHVTLELHRHGGHAGFVSGAVPWRARYWLEQRIPDFLQDYLDGSRA